MRSLFCLFLLAVFATPEPARGPQLMMLDMRPAFTKPATKSVQRNRVGNKPGIFIADKRYRGLNCPIPSRLGYDVKRRFQRFRVKVAILGAAPSGKITFRVLGDGQVLAATPPLFAGQPPLQLDVSVENVFLLELVIDGPPPRGKNPPRGAWVDGVFTGRAGADLSEYRPFDAPFSPKTYEVAFRRRVNRAINRGRDSLLGSQGVGRDRPGPVGSWTYSGRRALGETALVTLALLKAGVKPDDPQMVKAFEFMKGQPLNHTYSVAVLLMALEAKYFPGGADEKDAYKTRPRLAKKIISPEDQAWIKKAAAWLAGQQGKGYRDPKVGALNPVWRYPSGGYDLSNTQYALFGLAAANRCGVPTSRVWLPALRFLLGAQERDGPAIVISRYERRKNFVYRRYENAKARGFGYVINQAPTGSMTTAGVASIILCRHALHGKKSFGAVRGRTRAAIRDGLAWLEEYFDVDENPFRSGWLHYYLFNLERCGVLLDTRFIGTRDWYREGAEVLLARQDAAGGFGGNIDSAFAILFLKRATVPASTSPLD